MVMELPFTTSETDFAVYLIQSGFTLLGINYEPRANNEKARGIFVFKREPEIEQFRLRFANNQISVNLKDMGEFKKIKSGLLDRIMRELP
jgi:hypothetical protein